MSSDAPELGSYFVSNYPPFTAWEPDVDPSAALAQPPFAEAPLGVYAHIPFCRKRCRFCYFKVYTERPSSEVRAYLDAMEAEAAMYARQPVIGGRRPTFVYFGGGTPSFLSSDQIRQLFSGMRRHLDWTDDAEVTFECEPGTLRQAKVDALADHGVTRLSLGVENFDHELLELNGRAHGERHIEPAFEMARKAGIPQINIDLIAGMLGESDANWQRCIERTIALQPDSVTIYQMEVPYNTRIARTVREGGELGGTLASLATRRRWKDEAFQALRDAGYTLTSGYTAVRDDAATFVYRDSLWHGADLLGLGVSAFGHVRGVHLQNDKHIERYIARVNDGELPLQRGLVLTDEERMIRELILQLKLGRVNPDYFATKFGIDVRRRFAGQIAALQEEGHLRDDDSQLALTWDALLQVDHLLPRFFLPEHGGMQVEARHVG
jgi:oxygen-independent coproporphyrinogen-3 oxidase